MAMQGFSRPIISSYIKDLQMHKKISYSSNGAKTEKVCHAKIKRKHIFKNGGKRKYPTLLEKRQRQTERKGGREGGREVAAEQVNRYF